MGPAGTGKTTLAKHFAASMPGGVLFGAYTGKAAHVLRQKGCPGATTIHSMIYTSREKSRLRLSELETEWTRINEQAIRLPEGLYFEDRAVEARWKELKTQITAERKRLSQPVFALNPDSEVRRANLVIIDECSMVNAEMGQDLLSFGTKVLVLGDQAQLPPVFGGGFFTSPDPDFMLTEIHRQAADNPIIALATQVREGRQLELGAYGESRVLAKGDADAAMVLAADQVLVGKNVTRLSSNKRMRELLGRVSDGLPVPGDKLVCLRNNHDCGLLNGAIWYAEDVGAIDEHHVAMKIRSEDEGTSLLIEAHAEHFLGNGEAMPWWERKEAEEFTYGYALTTHKAQGSQWDDVLVFDESYCFRENRYRWLYTAITRAAEKVTVVRI
jgi:exodeoxyribonuclease-5